jgi:AcrR family transcriptional regulator
MARSVKEPEERRRELIAAALEIFCEKGYEQTSVRDILDVVGGEVGMFYHYFKSKEEIFGLAVGLFLEDYDREFSELCDGAASAELGIDRLVALVDRNITAYRQFWAGKLHWSMAAAVHKEMLERMIAPVGRLIRGQNVGDEGETARFLVYGISGVLHEKPMAELGEEEYRAKLRFVSETAKRLFGRR